MMLLDKWSRRRRAHRADDMQKRDEIGALERDTAALEGQIRSRWPEVREIYQVAQPRLVSNGFTDAVALAVDQVIERRRGKPA